jgi:2-hydroxy-3-keto-5-methylthiopentenyl-1-phosphate phosphatase
MPWRIFVDFDGTISQLDTTDCLLRRFASDAWEPVEDRWQAGLIGSRECLAEQVAMIRADERQLDLFAADFTIDPHFPEFVRQCAGLRLPLTVVSDGLDRVVRATLDRYGLGSLSVSANALTYRGDGKWALDFPHARTACRSSSGTCKCLVSRRASAGSDDQRDLRLLIGDGRSDYCLAEDADFVFARAGLSNYCQKRNIPHRFFHSFAEVQRLMSLLLEQTPVADAGTAPWGHQEMTNA